jgi:hypothetical protein
MPQWVLFPLRTRNSKPAFRHVAVSSMHYALKSGVDVINHWMSCQALAANQTEAALSHVQTVLQMLEKDVSEPASELKARTMALMSPFFRVFHGASPAALSLLLWCLMSVRVLIATKENLQDVPVIVKTLQNKSVSVCCHGDGWMDGPFIIVRGFAVAVLGASWR